MSSSAPPRKSAAGTRSSVGKLSRPLPQTPRTRPPGHRPVSPASTPPRLQPQNRAAWVLGGAGGAIVLYGVFIYRSFNNAVETSRQLNVPLDVSDRFNITAADYDDEVDRSERAMFLMGRRRKLARQATGHVLEVSVGTGRNMEFYNLKRDGCKTLTFVDQSPEMVEIARDKFKKLYPAYRHAVFRVQSASDPMPLPVPEGFDTIIQTMGLCSTPDPEGLLRNLGRLANQEQGRILLLEHGISHYAWLNRYLHDLAPRHADRYGCWWDKDIGKIVERSGLEVVKIKRYNLGTTWWVELRHRKEISKARDGR